MSIQLAKGSYTLFGIRINSLRYCFIENYLLSCHLFGQFGHCWKRTELFFYVMLCYVTLHYVMDMVVFVVVADNLVLALV